ncbi:hypothetical protein L2E82_33240 [Cichorium intybus]|uniref:Uncharacterized protein n=1 Tax=Cichorium intybus TaxID=13427 RepID=A0ACB9BJK6_CICIN|nr:hypothetical protein L2E82_33240 [Cichorium intybus]
MTRILTSYQNFKKTEELTCINLQEKLASESGDVGAADELTEIIQRHLEDKNIKQLDVTGLNQLDRHLHNFLCQVRIRKTQLKMGVVKGLQQQEMQLNKEKKIMMEKVKVKPNLSKFSYNCPLIKVLQIEAARMNEMTEDSDDDAAAEQCNKLIRSDDTRITLLSVLTELHKPRCNMQTAAANFLDIILTRV